MGSAGGGGISDNGGGSKEPSIAIAPDGTPYVAWHDESGGDDEIYVRRWTGSAWEEIGAGSATGGGISDNAGSSEYPSTAIAPDGTPYVAWYDDSGGNAEIYVRRWNGTIWEEVGAGSATGGGISNTPGASRRPWAAIAPDGTPYVTWSDADEIYVRRWNGTAWEEVGAGSATGGGISNNAESGRPSLVITPDGTPYIAWASFYEWEFRLEIHVRRWSGSAWEEVGAGSATGGGISDCAGDSDEPSAAIAPDGTPYVAWFNGDFRGLYGDIYVRRWNGSAWEEVGAGSATGGGISNAALVAWSPSLAIAPDGTPYVAWSDEDYDLGESEIYVRRWNGTVWEEVGLGSATGGGISNDAASWDPSLAISHDGTPYVAWMSESGGEGEIYVLRWVE